MPIKKLTVKDKHPGEHRYVTHRNGARPYVVYTGASTVTVYTVPEQLLAQNGWPDDKDLYTKLVKKISNVSKKFIPRYKKIRNFNATGNTLLLQVGKKYIHIGYGIFSFSAEPGDEIQKYYSPVGNSDVPYPIAVGKTHVYVVIEKKVVKKELFPKKIDWENDAIDFYYDFLANAPETRELSQLKSIKELRIDV